MSAIIGDLQAGKLVMGQNGRKLQWGKVLFAAAATTAALPLQMHQVECLFISPTAAPAAAVRSVQSQLGSVSATTSFLLVVPATGVISAAKLVEAAAVTADNTNYWSVGLVNKTQTLTAIDSTTAANTTKATGGSSLVGYAPLSLTLSGTAANLAVTAGDVLEVTITKTASATTLTETLFYIEVTPTAPADEVPYCADLNSSTSGTATVGAAGTVTLTRAGQRANSDAVYSYLAIGRGGM